MIHTALTIRFDCFAKQQSDSGVKGG